jgi:hypothetical protein
MSGAGGGPGTSGTYTWGLTTQRLIYGALRLLSAIESGEIPPDNEFEDALDALNGLVKQWQASGIHLWTEEDATLFLQPGQIQYLIGPATTDHCCPTVGSLITALGATAAAAATSVTLLSTGTIATGNPIGIWLDAGNVFWTTAAGAPSGLVVPLSTALPSQATAGNFAASYPAALTRPLRVPMARNVQLAPTLPGIVEFPMMPMSRLYYASVPNKWNPGTVTQFFFDPQLGQALMNCWPAPSDARSVMRFTAQMPLQDLVNAATLPDLPVEWLACLRFNLAKELALEYDCPPQRLSSIAQMAAEKFAMCSMWDREPESVRFGVGSFPTQRN